MSDTLLQTVEEKVMTLVSELEGLRKEVNRLRSENATLKHDTTRYAEKLQSLIALLDVLESDEQPTQVQMHAEPHQFVNTTESYAASF